MLLTASCWNKGLRHSALTTMRFIYVSTRPPETDRRPGLRRSVAPVGVAAPCWREHQDAAPSRVPSLAGCAASPDRRGHVAARPVTVCSVQSLLHSGRETRSGDTQGLPYTLGVTRAGTSVSGTPLTTGICDVENAVGGCGWGAIGILRPAGGSVEWCSCFGELSSNTTDAEMPVSVT